MKTITDQIGPVRVDHHAYLVRCGKLDLAAQFFITELKFVEYLDPVSGSWGTARFFHLPHTDTRIQLTEYGVSGSDKFNAYSDDQHLALSTTKPAKMGVDAICSWARHNGVGDWLASDPANAEETKWFVYLPEIFTFALEVVQVKSFQTT